MPLLILDLISPVLTWAIRLAAANAPETFHTILCAVPSPLRPTAARAGLLHFPFPYPSEPADHHGNAPPLLTPVDRASLRADVGLLNVCLQLVNCHKVQGKHFPLHTFNAVDLLVDQNLSVDEVMHVLTWWSTHAAGKLRLKVSNKLVDSASQRGLVPAVEWCLLNLPRAASHPPATVVFANALDIASENGHVHLLTWLHTHLPLWASDGGLDAYYSTHAMDSASQNGHLGVLDWWLHCGLPLKYSTRAMDTAPSPGVLAWWRTSDLVLRYSPAAMDLAARVDLLDWWRGSGLELQYTQPMERASAAGRVGVLDWWMEHVRPPCTPDICLVDASAAGHVHVLEWWVDVAPVKWGMCVDLADDIGAYVCAAADEDQTAVMQWWLNRLLDSEQLREVMLDAEYVEEWNTLEFATPKGNVQVLEAWKQSGLPVVTCSPWVLAVAAQMGHLPALRWWHAQLGRDVFCQAVFAPGVPVWFKAGQGGHLPVIEWLVKVKAGEHGLTSEPAAVALLVQGAIEGGCVRVLDWLAHRAPEGLCSLPAVAAEAGSMLDTASQLGHVHVLRWLFTHAPPPLLQFSRTALVAATKRGHVHVLRWWMDECGLRPLRFVLDEVMQVAIEFNQPWAWLFWIRHCDWRQAQEYQPTDEVVVAATTHHSWDILEWLAFEKQVDSVE